MALMMRAWPCQIVETGDDVGLGGQEGETGDDVNMTLSNSWN